MYEYRARLQRVVDGDTVDLVVDLGFSTFKAERFRLSGINAPESRTKDLEEKTRGKAATKFLEELLGSGEDLLIETELDKKGKYGRYLCTIYAPVQGFTTLQNVNRMMVNKGHAVFKEY